MNKIFNNQPVNVSGAGEWGLTVSPRNLDLVAATTRMYGHPNDVPGEVHWFGTKEEAAAERDRMIAECQALHPAAARYTGAGNRVRVSEPFVIGAVHHQGIWLDVDIKRGERFEIEGDGDWFITDRDHDSNDDFPPILWQVFFRDVAAAYQIANHLNAHHVRGWGDNSAALDEADRMLDALGKRAYGYDPAAKRSSINYAVLGINPANI